MTVTKDRFECDDIPEVRQAEVISWTSKTVEEDETHIAELKAKLAVQFCLVFFYVFLN